jgi:adenine/guanine phosphoribosyltransferase-like PRPP-binding protein
MITENRIAIIGSRGFDNYTYAKNKIIDIIKKHNLSITKIISGGADGADKIAEMFAQKFNIPIEIIKPNWELGKQAGVIRNTDIIKKSDCVIAFWDGKSKGTKDSIDKAKRMNKRIFIIKLGDDFMNEGVTLDSDDNFKFDFKNKSKDDLLTLNYEKNILTKRKRNGIITYNSYKINKKIDKDLRIRLLSYLKTSLIRENVYDTFINKAVIGIFNNPNFDVGNTDLILIPESTSNLNLEIATKIKNKIPNALFIRGSILKNDISNVIIDYEKVMSKNFKPESLKAMDKMLEKSIEDGVFKISKITPRFRKFFLNFLVLNTTNRVLLNRIVGGQVLVIDDIVTEGTTFHEIKRLLDNYAPEKIIYYSIIG